MYYRGETEVGRTNHTPCLIEHDALAWAENELLCAQNEY